MGIVMKKLAFFGNGAGIGIGFGFRCGYAREGRQGPAAPAFDPWDFAFGGGSPTTTSSAHHPVQPQALGNVYFEPRYNVQGLQLYVGVAGASISFPNRAAAEIDAYGGARLTVGQFAFDVGAWATCIGWNLQYGAANAFNGGTTDAGGVPLSGECLHNALVNANVEKAVSFFEVYAR